MASAGGSAEGSGFARRNRKPAVNLVDKLEEELASKLTLLAEETARNVHRRAEIELFSAVAACSAALEHLTLAAKEAAAGRAMPGEVQAAGQKALVDLGVHAERLRRLLHPGAYAPPSAQHSPENTTVDASGLVSRDGSSSNPCPPRNSSGSGAGGSGGSASGSGSGGGPGGGPAAAAAAGGAGDTAMREAGAGWPACSGAPRLREGLTDGSGGGGGGGGGGAGGAHGQGGPGDACPGGPAAAAAVVHATARALIDGSLKLETKTASHPVTAVDFTLRIIHETTEAWEKEGYLALWRSCVMRMLAALHRLALGGEDADEDPGDAEEVAQALYLLASVQSACFLSKPWTVSLLGVNMQTGQKAEVPPAVWDRFARAARLSEEQADILVSLNRWWKQSMAATAARRKHLAQVALGSPGDMELQEEVATQLDRANSVYLINSIVGMVVTTTIIWTPLQAAEMFVQPWPNQPTMTASLDAIERWLAATRAKRQQQQPVRQRQHQQPQRQQQQEGEGLAEGGVPQQ